MALAVKAPLVDLQALILQLLAAKAPAALRDRTALPQHLVGRRAPRAVLLGALVPEVPQARLLHLPAGKALAALRHRTAPLRHPVGRRARKVALLGGLVPPALQAQTPQAPQPLEGLRARKLAPQAHRDRTALREPELARAPVTELLPTRLPLAAPEALPARTARPQHPAATTAELALRAAPRELLPNNPAATRPLQQPPQASNPAVHNLPMHPQADPRANRRPALAPQASRPGLVLPSVRRRTVKVRRPVNNARSPAPTPIQTRGPSNRTPLLVRAAKVDLVAKAVREGRALLAVLRLEAGRARSSAVEFLRRSKPLVIIGIYLKQSCSLTREQSPSPA